MNNSKARSIREGREKIWSRVYSSLPSLENYSKDFIISTTKKNLSGHGMKVHTGKFSRVFTGSTIWKDDSRWNCVALNRYLSCFHYRLRQWFTANWSNVLIINDIFETFPSPYQHDQNIISSSNHSKYWCSRYTLNRRGYRLRRYIVFWRKIGSKLLDWKFYIRNVSFDSSNSNYSCVFHFFFLPQFITQLFRNITRTSHKGV